MCIKYSTLVKTNFSVKVDCEDVFLLWWQCEGNSDVLRKKPHIAWQQYNLQHFRPICMFITLGYRTSCKTKGVDCENVKVHHFLVPLTTVPVCADTSWWRRQALTCGYSYTNSLCRNMDETQKFSTVWESGSVPSSVEVNCCLLSSRWFSSFSSKSLMQSFRYSMCSSSADILWASDSQWSAHWLLRMKS